MALSRALVYGSDRVRPARDFCCWALIGAERSPVSCSVIEGRAGVSETNQTEGREISFTRRKRSNQCVHSIVVFPCIVVIDAEKVDRSWSTFTLPRRQRMSILDEITKEKQRVSEALGRVDAQREKLTSQLSELEATERVLARYSKGTQARKTAPATATGAAPAPGRGRRTTTARPAGGKRGSSSLNDQVLALATGKTQQEITAACKGARPNHVGAAIARHKRAGRVEERDGKLYATQPTGTEQHVAAV